MRIALDAMGTDNRPAPDVLGGILAAREYGVTVIMVGDRQRIEHELKKHDTHGLSIEIVDAPQEILMQDKPRTVASAKADSSIHVGLKLVRDGKADAFVSMGNTGAIHMIATVRILRPIEGIERPALTTLYAVDGKNTVFLDIGANVDVKAEVMEQFAIMGSLYAQTALKIANPRIATLSNGEEEGKGNKLTQETQERLRTTTLNYVGHIEPKEMLEGKADVIIMDGFVGNIFIKTFEASIRYFTKLIRDEVNASWLHKLGALLMKGAFKRIRKKLDTGEVGGAPLLGVNGVVIIGHGGSDANAVKNAINQACRAVAGGTTAAIQQHFARANLTNKVALGES